MSPYNRAGNPRCCAKSCVNEWGWGPEMIRAYVRLGDPRKWIPIGWYCEKCKILEPDSDFEKGEHWPHNPVRIRPPKDVNQEGRRLDMPRSGGW